DIAREERVAAREALCAELEALASPNDVRLKPDATSPDATRAEGDLSDVASGFSRTEAPQDLVARVQAVRARWQQEIAARGVDRDRAIALDRRFAAAVAAVTARWPSVFAGGDLDPAANLKR